MWGRMGGFSSFHLISLSLSLSPILKKKKVQFLHERNLGSRECIGYASAFRQVLYQRGWFDNWTDPIATHLYDYSHVPKECKLHDDVYISGMLWRQTGIRPFFVVSCSFLVFGGREGDKYIYI